MPRKILSREKSLVLCRSTWSIYHKRRIAMRIAKLWPLISSSFFIGFWLFFVHIKRLKVNFMNMLRMLLRNELLRSPTFQCALLAHKKSTQQLTLRVTQNFPGYEAWVQGLSLHEKHPHQFWWRFDWWIKSYDYLAAWRGTTIVAALTWHHHPCRDAL